MGEKDITTKILEAYDDVFADIVNVFLFQGRQIVHENELEDAQPTSAYKAEGKVHGQERDVSKRIANGEVRIASIGIENQTGVDADMPLRVIGYDGASYRSQLLSDNASQNRYPVLTVVLLYDHEHSWSGPKRLKERLVIPPEFDPFVSDYQMNVFSMADLTREDVGKFKSDFRFVADYYVQRRENHDYIPPRENAEHLEAVVQLLSVMEKDERYDEIYQELKAADPMEGGPRNMCEVLDRAIDKGVKQGIEIERKNTENVLQKEQENGLRMLFDFVADGDLPIAKAMTKAVNYGVTDEADFRKRAAALGIKLPE